MTRFLLAALVDASRGWSGGQPDGAMLSATRAFLAGAEQNPPLLEELAASIARHEDGAAAWLAVTSGTAVERGASPVATGPAMLELLRTWLPKLPAWNDDAGEGPPPPSSGQSKVLELLPFLCQSVVTHLARLPDLRERVGRDTAFLERLDQVGAYSHGAIWVREALTKSSGALVLLHPSTRTGLRLRYTNVSNNFHLFSLLQAAVGTTIEGGRVVDETIANVARGESTEDVSDEAWWHYGVATSNEPKIADSIWGEGLVREIPEIEGVRVVLAWSKLLESRRWDAGFLGPHLEALPADVVVEGSLSAEEANAWLDRLGIRSKKKWWPFK
jgi:hypothetical protein